MSRLIARPTAMRAASGVGISNRLAISATDHCASIRATTSSRSRDAEAAERLAVVLVGLGLHGDLERRRAVRHEIHRQFHRRRMPAHLADFVADAVDHRLPQVGLHRARRAAARSGPAAAARAARFPGRGRRCRDCRGPPPAAARAPSGASPGRQRCSSASTARRSPSRARTTSSMVGSSLMRASCGGRGSGRGFSGRGHRDVTRSNHKPCSYRAVRKSGPVPAPGGLLLYKRTTP